MGARAAIGEDREGAARRSELAEDKDSADDGYQAGPKPLVPPQLWYQFPHRATLGGSICGGPRRRHPLDHLKAVPKPGTEIVALPHLGPPPGV